MKIDRQSRQFAKKYFRACRNPDGSLNEQGLREIVQLLVEQKPRNFLAILTLLYRLVELAWKKAPSGSKARPPLADRWRRHLRRASNKPTALPPAPSTNKIPPSSADFASVAATTSGTAPSAAASTDSNKPFPELELRTKNAELIN